jgi:hypothetical protein
MRALGPLERLFVARRVVGDLRRQPRRAIGRQRFAAGSERPIQARCLVERRVALAAGAQRIDRGALGERVQRMAFAERGGDVRRQRLRQRQRLRPAAGGEQGGDA